MMGEEDVMAEEVKKVEEVRVSSESAAPPSAPEDPAKDVVTEEVMTEEERIMAFADEMGMPREVLLQKMNRRLGKGKGGLSFSDPPKGKVYRPPPRLPDIPIPTPNRDTSLAILEAKKLSVIKAWKESEKAKAENNAVKMMSTISVWENSKIAAIDADLKNEEALKNKKAGYAEKQKNKIAEIHKEAKEKRAIVAAKRGEDLLKAEEMAAKYRVTGFSLKKLLGCF